MRGLRDLSERADLCTVRHSAETCIGIAVPFSALREAVDERRRKFDGSRGAR